jgi:hypothetical protein
MNIRIDSYDIVGQLAKDDVIFQVENEKYKLTQITDQHIMAIHIGAFSRLKLFYITDLIKDNWYLEKAEESTRTVHH